MKIGLGHLRMPAPTFWAMTLRELFAAMDGYLESKGVRRDGGTAPSREEVQSLFDLPVPPADVGVPVVHTAQSAADLMVRIQDLEGTVRNLTGQVEVLQHQLAELQAAMQTMQQDNEFRFQELEGGAGKKSEAATSGADPVQPLEAPPPLTN